MALWYPFRIRWPVSGAVVLGDKRIYGCGESVGGHPGNGLNLRSYLLYRHGSVPVSGPPGGAMIMEIPVKSMFCIQVGSPIRTMERTDSSLGIHFQCT